MIEPILQGERPLMLLLAVMAGALLAGALAQRLLRQLVLRLNARFSVLDCLIRHVASPLRLAMPLLFLQVALSVITVELDFLPMLRHGAGILLIVSLTWLASTAIAGVADAVSFLRPVSQSDNLAARRIQTQTKVIAGALKLLVAVIGFATILMTFPAIRALGASLLASAGLAGIVAGLAARPVLGNLIAGLQIALSQPIRLDDVVVIEGEWGRIEEITGTYVVVAIWDQRRLVVPLQWIIEHPFQNWTRNTSQIIGTVFLWVDYRLPLAPLREELERLCRDAPEWDSRLCLLQVTDASERSMQLRALVTSIDSARNWDLRCRVREGMISFIQKNHPDALPRLRASVEADVMRDAKEDVEEGFEAVEMSEPSGS